VRYRSFEYNAPDFVISIKLENIFGTLVQIIYFYNVDFGMCKVPDKKQLIYMVKNTDLIYV
jgi:hypothetical protein